MRGTSRRRAPARRAMAQKERTAESVVLSARQGNVVPMLVKSFELLEAFREHPEGLTYPELVRLYPQFSRVSIFRILCSLERTLYLERAHNTNRYVLGAKFIELGRIAESRLGLLEVALPHMEKLLSQFNENVNLGTVQNFELVYFKTLESGHVLRVHEMPNRRIAVHCSALGKAVLAHLGEEAVQQYLRTTPLTRLTPTTISSVAEFHRELKAIRERGYAIDNEENLQGVRCVAVPILDGQGRPMAGLSISGPSTRMADDRLVEMAGAMKQACAAVKARFAPRHVV